MTGRTYTTTLPNKIAGRVVVAASGRVNLIPALRWLPAQEITRAKAADILREHRRAMALKARPALAHELPR